MFRLSTAQLWVHDQDEALAFWTSKVGFEVRQDVTLAEMGNFRWLTVGPVGQPDIAIVLMAIPGAPMIDAETGEQIRSLMSKGFAGTVFLTTDDCRGSLRGVDGTRRGVHRDAGGPSLRHRRRLPRPLRQCDSADPGPRPRRGLSPPAGSHTGSGTGALSETPVPTRSA